MSVYRRVLFERFHCNLKNTSTLCSFNNFKSYIVTNRALNQTVQSLIGAVTSTIYLFPIYHHRQGRRPNVLTLMRLVLPFTKCTIQGQDGC